MDALSNCVFHGYSIILDKLLCCQEIDPNQGDNQLSNQVPLVIAIERNNYQIIKRLLECSNINVNIHEHLNGLSMLQYAVEYNDYKLLEVLLNCDKIDLNEKNVDGMSVIELMYIKNDSFMLRQLIDMIRLERV